MAALLIATATERDFEELWRLECACFEKARRSSRRSLRRSLRSGHQIVRLGRSEAAVLIVGYAVLIPHLRTLRIYSVAVAVDQQGRGLGQALIRDAVALAVTAGCHQISLEVDALDRSLVAWYERQDFTTAKILEDYYGPGRSALRMRRKLGHTRF